MNYRQIYAIKAKREQQIKNVAPSISKESGIYVFHRVDENGIKHAYVGQAKHLLERTASHLGEYDHIGISLKKRGLYSAENSGGWQLKYKECAQDDLDENERKTIKHYADNGYQLYNATLGGQGEGKANIKDGKTSKGYYDGVEQGEKNVKRFVANLFNKHLDYKTKSDKPNKNQEKAMQKFKDFLEG